MPNLEAIAPRVSPCFTVYVFEDEVVVLYEVVLYVVFGAAPPSFAIADALKPPVAENNMPVNANEEKIFAFVFMNQ